MNKRRITPTTKQELKEYKFMIQRSKMLAESLPLDMHSQLLLCTSFENSGKVFSRWRNQGVNIHSFYHLSVYQRIQNFTGRIKPRI